MPEFPRAHSDRALTTRQPRAFRDDADIQDQAGKRTKIASNAVAQVTETANKWNQAVEKIQTDTAMYNFKVGLQEIANEAVNENDIAAESRYQKKVQDLKKEVVGGINNPGLVNRMGPELDYMVNMGSLGIQKTFRDKTVIHGQKVKTQEMALAAQTGDIDGIAALAKDGVSSGYWNELEAYKLETKYKKEARENMFIQDLNDNPAEAEKALARNAYGFDVEELDNAGKVFERQLNVIQNQTAEEFMQMKLDGTLKDEDLIRQAVAIKKLDPKVGIAMIKDLNTVVAPKATALDKTTEFNKLVAMRDALKSKESAWLGLGNADWEQRANYRAAVFNAHASGLITDAEMSTDFLQEEVTAKFMNDPKFQNSMKEIYDMSEQYMSKEDRDIAKAEMSKSITRKVMGGMAPADALSETIIERVAADFPGVDPVSLVYTAKKRGAKVWQIYKLIKAKGETGGN